MKFSTMRLAALAAAMLLASCKAGPDYVRPGVDAPGEESGVWKPAEPRDHEPRGRWWEAFNDPLLNDLQEQVDISNQNLLLAAAQFRQARALVDAARSGYFPTLTLDVSKTRSRSSATTIAQPSANPVSRGVVTSYGLGFSANWEADVWGRISRTVEASEAGAEASEADLESARLSAHADLAQNYFQLRVLDAQKQLLDNTVAVYQKSLQLSTNQYNAGVVSKSDVVLAQTQLKTTQAQAIDLGVQRAQLQHAIALLAGTPASGFALPPLPLAAAPPPAPRSVKSELLERRPDIAAAERRVKQANAQIGVASAAFFPSLLLSAGAGYQSATFANWLTAPSRFWSFGPAIVATLFDGGLRRAQSEQAVAVYDASVAVYRQTVLNAFREVEDNLAALQILEEEARVQDEALQLARQSVALATNQYKAGTVNFLAVVILQATALNAERAALDILNRRLVATVLLVKALGGGWSEGELLPPQRR